MATSILDRHFVPSERKYSLYDFLSPFFRGCFLVFFFITHSSFLPCNPFHQLVRCTLSVPSTPLVCLRPSIHYFPELNVSSYRFRVLVLVSDQSSASLSWHFSCHFSLMRSLSSHVVFVAAAALSICFCFDFARLFLSFSLCTLFFSIQALFSSAYVSLSTFLRTF